ncbi:MAG: YfhO family protein [Flavobacteriales bacterium]
MNTLLKKALPHIIAILSFVVISVAFYTPALTGKQKLKMGDINQWKGMSHELVDFEAKTGQDAVWTNSMFSGMPAYQIYIANNGNIVNTLDSVYKLWLPRPIDILFKAMLGFYILLMCFRVNPVVGAISAISFGLSSFFIIYLGAGHASKMNSITYIAPMLGGIIYTFRRHALKGAVITAFFLCLHLGANHLQMTYYAFIMLIIVGTGELIRSVLNKETARLPKVVGFLLLGGLLGVIPNYGSLSTTAEYGKYSTRGESELTISPEKDQMVTTTDDGLGKDYILQYSMANGEWFSVYMPNVKGGVSGNIGQNNEATSAMSRQGRDFVKQYSINQYWGEQLGTGGAFYFGAFMFFLAICAIFLLKDSIRWSLLGVAIIAILASWKLGGVPDFFIDNVPLWNKFRDTKMMLILLMLIVPLLGALFLNKFLMDGEYRTANKKKFFMVAGGFLVLNLLILSSPGSIFEFASTGENGEQSLFGQLRSMDGGQKIINDLIAGRKAIFTADLTRSLIIFLVGAAALALASFKKDYAKYIAFGLGVLFLGDMWSVNHRYYDSKTAFESTNQNRVPFPAMTAEKQILAQEKQGIEDFSSKVKEATALYKEQTGDTRLNDSEVLQRELEVLNQNTNYRVLNIGNPWSDARTSYFHKSIGGYHGAKLKNYSELIDFYLGNETNQLLTQLQNQQPIAGDYWMLSMLNTKYIIGNPNAGPIPFSGGLGNAWFIKDLNSVPDADAEITALGSTAVDSVAVIQEKFSTNLATSYDNYGGISLTSYEPNHLTYSVNADGKRMAIFSEIYYPAGWNAYIDGTLTDHVKVNYVLRGLEIPAGAKLVEFKFEPQTYHTGKTISLAGSVILILLCLGMLAFSFKENTTGLKETKQAE